MKFLHISDLHIGKRVHEFSMLKDQKHILGKILEIAGSEQVDGILLAGDIYDKPVPSAEAVQLFDWFLTSLSERKIKVFVVSGNHDSAERLAFGSQIMSGRDVYISPVYDGDVAKIELEDEYGKLCVYLLPFVKPAVINHALELKTFGQEISGQEEIDQNKKDGPFESYQDALAAAVGRIALDDGVRNILVAHQFVTGAGRCDSESVAVGGLDNVDADVFDGFDYVALGHIHSPQWMKRETVRYSGTPLKYSFSESTQQKSVVIIECKEKENIQLCTVDLTPMHDMKKIRGSYQEVMARSFYQELDTEDYFQITLTDEEDVPDAMARLRVIYPNLMQLLYDNSRTKQNHTMMAAQAMETKSELELFEEFYELQNNQPMGKEQVEFVTKLLEDVQV